MLPLYGLDVPITVSATLATQKHTRPIAEIRDQLLMAEEGLRSLSRVFKCAVMFVPDIATTPFLRNERTDGWFICMHIASPPFYLYSYHLT